MMKDRWRSTRSRLKQEIGTSDPAGLWSRIDASRRAGQSVDLPAADPRRPVSPILLGVLTVAVVVILATQRHRNAPTGGPGAISETDESILHWLPTPAYAQGTGMSTLPPIDPPDLSRMVPGRLVYEYMEGADGILTQHGGTDTSWVARDTVEGVSRVILSNTSRKGNKYSDTDAVDSLVIAADGTLLFWRWKVSNLRKNRVVTVSTTLLTDSVQVTYIRNDGLPTKIRVRPGNYGYQLHSPLLGLLPALPLQLGYARSVSVMDLVRGETTPGFTRSVELRVTGKDWVAVPAGRFHCWVVEYSVVPGPGEERYTSRLDVDMKSGALVRAEWGRGATFSEEQTLIDRRAE